MSVKAYGVRSTHVTAYAFLITSASEFHLPSAEYQGIFLSGDECQGMSRPVDTHYSRYLPDDECQGILPSRGRVSEHISSGRRVSRHVASGRHTPQHIPSG